MWISWGEDMGGCVEGRWSSARYLQLCFLLAMDLLELNSKPSINPHWVRSICDCFRFLCLWHGNGMYFIIPCIYY